MIFLYHFYDSSNFSIENTFSSCEKGSTSRGCDIFIGRLDPKNQELVDSIYLGIRFEVIVFEIGCEEIG